MHVCWMSMWMCKSFSTARKCYKNSYVTSYINAMTCGNAVQQRSQGKNSYEGSWGGHKHETRCQKTWVTDFALLLTSWIDKNLVRGSASLCTHSEGINLDVHQAFTAVKVSWLIEFMIVSIVFEDRVVYEDPQLSFVLFFLFLFFFLLLFICITRFPSSIHRRGKVKLSYNKMHNVCIDFFQN